MRNPTIKRTLKLVLLSLAVFTSALLAFGQDQHGSEGVERTASEFVRALSQGRHADLAELSMKEFDVRSIASDAEWKAYFEAIAFDTEKLTVSNVEVKGDTCWLRLAATGKTRGGDMFRGRQLR